MDELLTDEQQSERAKQWLRENGAFILAGIVAGIAGLFGWQAWQDSALEQAGQASVAWEGLRDAIEGERFNEVDERLEILETEYGSSAYLDQSRLAVARMYMDRNDPDAAATALRELIAAGNDRYLRRVAELRLAQIQIYQEDYAAALATLGPRDESGLAGFYHELRGDIFVAQGELESARDEYELALDAAANGVLDRGYVQIKLDDVIGSITAAALAEPSTDNSAAEPAAE